MVGTESWNRNIAQKSYVPFAEGLEVLLIGSRIRGLRQHHNPLARVVVDPMTGLSSSISIHQSSGPFLSIGRQDALHLPLRLYSGIYRESDSRP